MGQCIICNSILEEENAAVLEMGAYGTPKYLCPQCAADLDTATLGTDLDEISAAMDRVTKKVTEGTLSPKTFATVNSILESAAERAKAIKNGTYDFSLDNPESETDSFDEIPEELRETEEDKKLDKEDEERTEKVNRFLDYVSIGAVIGVAAFLVWKLVEIFLL